MAGQDMAALAKRGLDTSSSSQYPVLAITQLTQRVVNLGSQPVILGWPQGSLPPYRCYQPNASGRIDGERLP